MAAPREASYSEGYDTGQRDARAGKPPIVVVRRRSSAARYRVGYTDGYADEQARAALAAAEYARLAADAPEPE
jgi:hypothetical protein